MDYTIDQLKSALDSAIGSGDKESADHIKGLIDKQTGESDKYPAAPTPYGVGGGTALSGMRDYVDPSEQAAATVRYGVPILAGIATAPVGGGVPGYLAASGVSALSSGGSEYVAQLIEKFRGERPEGISGREIISSTAAGLAVPLKLKEHSSMVNFLTNAGIFGTSNETSRAIREGGFTASESGLEGVSRVVLPFATAYIGTKSGNEVEKVNRYAERRAAVQKQRFGGSFVLSDLDESFTEIERKAIAGNSKKVRQLMEDMSSNYGDEVRKVFKDTANAEKLAEPFIQYQGRVDALQRAVQDASAEYDLVKQQVAKARSDNLSNLSDLERQANDAASEVVKSKALYEKGLDRMFGGLGSDALQFTTNERMSRVGIQIDGVKKSIKGSISKLYSDAGINQDDIVANEADIISWIDAGKLSQKDKIKYADIVETVLKKPGMKDDVGNISLKAYRDMRDEIADDFRKAGKDANSAQREAGQVYESIKLASEDFLERNMPDRVVQFKNANSTARGIYAAREGELGAVGFIEDKNVGGLIDLIKKEGYKRVLPEIDAYAGAIRGLGDDASVAASEQFVSDLHKSIRDEIIGQSLIEGSGKIEQGFKAVDMNKLARNLSSIISEKGVPADLIGLGSKNEINALARLAQREGRRGFTVTELNSFFDDVGAVGYDRALARKDYEESMRVFYTKTNKAEKQDAMNRALLAEKKAGMSLSEASELAEKAAQDPLAQLMNNKSFFVDPDSSKNGQWIAKLLTVGESDLDDLMRTLRAPSGKIGPADVFSRKKLAEDISKATTAELLFRPLRSAIGESGQMIDLTGITNLFYGEGNKAFKAIVGKDAFDSLKDTWGRSAADVLQKRIKLGLSAFTNREDMMAAAAAISLARGSPSTGMVVGTGINRITSFIDRGRYSMLWLMYGEPSTSKAFKEAAYNVDKFMSLSTRNAMLVKLAEREDNDKEKAALLNRLGPLN